MSCYCKFTVTLPHGGAVGWSAMCECGIPDHTHLLSEIVFISSTSADPDEMPC